ncbi:hypothetical protein SPI_09215 [Niveomyces insectorum RCEF 264]|uniref:Uncharacterized protein n=1 Tax=Niveomyces insectorum RCEF 264 TaxID=1081102 RepID=A0A162MBF2_9HYPO|nr:hypothetical protein SPI_09215 [Niveomyces insectorum RCEF 264]
MPRFPSAFNRRKSTADNSENAAVAGPSFRVLDRAEVAVGGRNFDAPPSHRAPIKSQTVPTVLSAMDAPDDDNIFAGLKINRGSGSSNTTKTNSTDNSSRHSNASTAPSSADFGGAAQAHSHAQHQSEDWKLHNKRLYGDVPLPPVPKSSSTSNFLKNAGRTFSFGGQKKHLPLTPSPEEKPPQTPPTFTEPNTTTGRERAMTASTVTTATPPKLEEEFSFDLGGDFRKMLGGFDKRTSVATVRDDGTGRQPLVPRSLTGNRLNQPAPIRVDGGDKVDPSPYSWGSQNSGDQLLQSHSLAAPATNGKAPPVPRHASPLGNRPQTASGATSAVASDPNPVPPLPSTTDSGLKRTSAVFGRRRSTIDYAVEGEDEDTVLLKDSLASVNKFLAGSNSSNTKSFSPSNRFRRSDESHNSGYKQVPTGSTSPVLGSKPATEDEDNLFDSSLVHSNKMAQRFVSRKPSPPRNKVMTPAQFERYRKDKEREDHSKDATESKRIEEDNDDDEEDNYEDDLDEVEKSKQAAKQRRKQEAHMTVYRQQMMKVTGEAASGTPARASLAFSLSTPNLPTLGAGGAGRASGTSPQGGSDNEDEDEEVPLAILAAHGFPNRNRPPTRLSTMMSNPNLRASAAPGFQRPQSVMGDPHGGGAGSATGGNPGGGGGGGRLPPFARNLPQDPYGLVNSNARETLNFSAGAPASGMPQASSAGVPPGGLVGVIANEERSRAMRRGSPALDAINKPLPSMAPGPQFDPVAGIPPQMMYPGMGLPQPMLTPGDQAQIQMTQQMQQFMQMQMQFMQMMASNNGANGMQRPPSQYTSSGMSQANLGMGAMGNMGGMGAIPGVGGFGMSNNDMMRHSFVENGSTMDMPTSRPDMHTRTMSLVQPSSASWIQPLGNPNYTPSIRIQGVNGYAPSIAPSERSNIGLPGRYRPVSHAPAGPPASELRKSMAMSGVVGVTASGTSTSASPNTSGSVSPSEPNPNPSNGRGPSPTGWDFTRKQKNHSPLNKSSTADDDDDEEGWAAMKAKRDKKRSLWKTKKSLPSEIGAMIS